MRTHGVRTLANDPGFLLLMLTFVVGTGFAVHDVNRYINERLRNASANNMKMVGLACKVFANANPAEVWPAVSFSPRPFSLDPSDLNPQYEVGQRIVSTAKRRRGRTTDRRTYYYLGYAFRNETMALEFLRAVREEGPEDAMARRPIETRFGPVYPLKFMIESHLRYQEQQYREQKTGRIEHGCGTTGPSKIPVLIEHPDIFGDGGHVLFMDGRVDFMEYPGEFPMTERFIAELESFE